ncbi:preprotein translocase subunit SecE [Candidatus Uhrbacteria bacterium RIFCSPHIGHO2_12_FULL_60_25]|uniref:Protein translocase subunit SecE n=1 Tax=Candidatus Uhrbacteria bacterium RIFCSPHIGHO2_12_FULL_60_25 TaxID=1802399 RepID=A0A1F7UN54_9BACT|nr:MAG: preprotein translocase subunit SecE [Candidatus Uhrbacteria bacterium RIFCSPHIGHO2_02_FULL_60_44]OGL79675.1 MAG: preprotein translocase subunit SecE [Candidatus Uhrbacteria bacterium RIFCSPHIGHO2_12_FULL_60_25]
MSNPITSIRDYLRSSIGELKKVTWPSRQMTIRYSLLVIVASAALAVFFAALDFGLSRAVTIALSRKNAVETEQPVTPDVTPQIEGTPTPIQVEAQPAGSSPAPAPDEGGLQLPPIESPKP